MVFVCRGALSRLTALRCCRSYVIHYVVQSLLLLCWASFQLCGSIKKFVHIRVQFDTFVWPNRTAHYNRNRPKTHPHSATAKGDTQTRRVGARWKMNEIKRTTRQAFICTTHTICTHSERARWDALRKRVTKIYKIQDGRPYNLRRKTMWNIADGIHTVYGVWKILYISWNSCGIATLHTQSTAIPLSHRNFFVTLFIGMTWIVINYSIRGEFFLALVCVVVIASYRRDEHKFGHTK